MAIHQALIFSVVQEWAQEEPYIIAGDFNIRPNTELYHYMVGPEFSETGVILDESVYHVDTQKKYDILFFKQVKSAHKEFHGCEPLYTTQSMAGLVNFQILWIISVRLFILNSTNVSMNC